MGGLLEFLFDLIAKTAGHKGAEELDRAATNQILSDVQSGKSDKEIMMAYGISKQSCLRFRRKKTHWLLEREGLSAVCASIVFFVLFFCVFFPAADRLKLASNGILFYVSALAIAFVPACVAYVLAHRYLFRDVYIDVSRMDQGVQAVIFAVLLLGFIGTVLFVMIRG
ncbi:MAG: hypothetical protein V1792_08595 [Pseudomonadota bacterium]